jgi:peptide/nickel transport system substrate-binding protein
MKLSGVLLVVAAVIMMLYVDIAWAEQKPQISVAAPTSIIYTPGTPVWNPYAPSNLIGAAGTWLPFAGLNIFTGQLLPILAENWTIQVLPNGSGILTVYLRHDIYWFNGSAVMPFTAWDAYAEFYIGVKAFSWYYPYMLPQYADEDIRVLNNYTIQFLFQKWGPLQWYYLMTQWIETPWPVYKPIVEKLQSMNAAEAAKYSSNITEFVAPYWALSPYYVSSISSSVIVYSLEPLYYNGVPLLETWNKVFPYATWNYYAPTAIDNYVVGNVQALTAFLAGKANWGWIGLSAQQISELPSTWDVIYSPDVGFGISLNPNIYPFNLPQVRQALLGYLVNETATGAAWSLMIMRPQPMQTPATFPVLSTYPSSILSMVFNYTYDPNKAAQLLQSVGLRYRNGQWLLPNGTPLTITILGPSGWTNVLYIGIVAANEWSGFGIQTKVISEDTGLFWGTIVPNGEYEAITTFGSWGDGYLTIWNWLQWPWWAIGSAVIAPYTNHSVYPFAWPNVTNGVLNGWYCTPVSAPVSLNLPNNTIVWCVNSTFGYVNLTNLRNLLVSSVPGSPEYEEAIKVYFAWWEYFIPMSTTNVQFIPIEYAKYINDPKWMMQCLTLIQREGIIHATWDPGIPWGWPNGIMAWVLLGGVAPQGIVPPLAQAIANGSLWTQHPEWAKWLDLSPDPSLQACVASYFHIPYTPVTTTTTAITTTTTATAVSTVTSTATVTSTVTSTVASTTTAVSTVTVTKTVISTALVVGIVVIVVVIAAVAALIALRRR